MPSPAQCGCQSHHHHHQQQHHHHHHHHHSPDGHHSAVPRPLAQPHVGLSLGVQAEAHPGQATQLRHLQARPVAEEDDALEYDSCDSLMTA